MSDAQPPLDATIAARRAQSRRLAVGAVLGLVVALLIGAGLWWWIGDLALAAGITGILAIVLPGPAAALARRRS